MKASKRARKKSLYGAKHPPYSPESTWCSLQDCHGAEDVWKPPLGKSVLSFCRVWEEENRKTDEMYNFFLSDFYELGVHFNLK